MPKEVLESASALVGCVAGAVLIDDTIKMAQNAGLTILQRKKKNIILMFWKIAATRYIKKLKK